MPSSSCFRICIDHAQGQYRRRSGTLHIATHRYADRLFFLAGNRGLESQPTDQLLSRIELLLCGGVVRLERENLRHVLGVSGHSDPEDIGSATHVLEVDNCCFRLENGQVGYGPPVVSLSPKTRNKSAPNRFEWRQGAGRALTARLSSSIARATVSRRVSILSSPSYPGERSLLTGICDGETVFLQLEPDGGAI